MFSVSETDPKKLAKMVEDKNMILLAVTVVSIGMIYYFYNKESSCADSKHGCCSDGKTKKTSKAGTNCDSDDA
jgi:hypothetical protein